MGEIKSENKDDLFARARIPRLETDSQISIWLSRAEDALANIQCWDDSTNQPKNTSQARYLLTSALSDEYYSAIIQLSEVKPTATTVWEYISSLLKKSNLSVKSTTLMELVSFNFSGRTMLQNRSAIQELHRRLIYAFNESATTASSKTAVPVVKLSELVTLFSLVNLPAPYHALRSTMEENSKSTEITLKSLYESLEREESSQKATANRVAQAPAKSAKQPSAKANSTDAKCVHGRAPSTCYQCDPSKRPTCELCKQKNISQHLHKTGTTFCKLQQLQHATSTPSTAPIVANRTKTIRFNPDSACTDHIVNDNKAVAIYSSLSRPIQVASGQFVQSTGIGKLSSPSLPLDNVLVCKQITENLLSISKLADTGLDTLFTSQGVFVGTGGSLQTTHITGPKTGSIYSLDIPLQPQSDAFATKTNSMMDWHLRLNHLNSADISRMYKQVAVVGLDVNPNEELPECSACMIGKARHGSGQTHPSTFKPTRCGELVSMDITGPVTPESHRGYTYVLMITDAYSGYITIFLLKLKSEALNCFTTYNNQLSNRIGRNVSILRSDNEFRTNMFASYCNSKGIVQQFIVPYESQQMGNGERVNLTLFNPVRASLLSAQLSQEFWCDAAKTVIYTRNRSLSTSNPKQTPFELWYGHKPVVSHLQTFGAKCYAYISVTYRRRTGTSKLADRAAFCRFLGYSDDSKSYQLRREHDGVMIPALYSNVRFSSAPISDTPSNEVEPDEMHMSSYRTSNHHVVPSSPVSVSNYYSALDDDGSASLGNSTSDSSSDPHIDDGSASLGNSTSDSSSDSHNDDPSSDVDSHIASNSNPNTTNPTTAPTPSMPKMARNPFREVSELPASRTMPLYESFQGEYIPPNPQPVLQNSSGPSYVLQDVSQPAPRDITVAAAPDSKRKRTIVDYSEANSSKKAAYTSLVTAMHAGFSSVDTLVQLTNHGHHQWYRSRAYATNVPQSYNDITKSDASEEWYKAADDEISQLIKFGTWKLVPRPPGNVLKNKWVFRIKEKDGVIVRYKARLCACGYSQVAGVDYKDLFSPTVQSASFRLQLSLIAQRAMKTKQLDVTGAFLYGVPEETLHMEQIPGYVDSHHPDWVCLLLRNLYGLKQAPRTWHLTIDPFIKSLGFTANAGDPCLYQRWSDKKLFIIALHVDDMLLAADCGTQLETISDHFKLEYTMTDDGEVSRILGLTITRDLSKSAIYISQPDAIDSMLTKFNMLDCVPFSTPIDSLTVSSHDCPAPNSDAQLAMVSIPYREACGSLMALAMNSRPDICYAVGVACRYMHNPGLPHWNLVKRIFRYLKGTQYLKLTVGPSTPSVTGLTSYHSSKSTSLSGPNHLLGVADSDWAGDKDGARSTTGYLFYWGSSILSWGSKLQSTVSSSTTMAEYISTYTAALEALWLRTVLISLTLLSEGTTVPILCDNDGAISLSKFHMTTNRTKHIETKFHLVRENVLSGKIQIQSVPTSENVADIFTKPLPRSIFVKHRISLGLQ